MTDSEAPGTPSLRHRLRRFSPVTPVLLALVWVLLWGSVNPATVVGGLLLGYLTITVFPLPPLHLGVWVRPWPLFVLASLFLLDLVKASIHVALHASAPWIIPHGRIVHVGLRSDHDLFGVLTAELTALVPGSIVIDLNTTTREMILHVFDEAAGDDETVRQRVLTQEARVLHALARDADAILATEPADLQHVEALPGHTEDEKKKPKSRKSKKKRREA